MQSFRDFEVIVVDDASEDKTAQFVEQYADSRIHLYRHSHNRGPGPSRNTGIKHSNGLWCVMLDSDFALLPGALENLFVRTQQTPVEVANVASSCLWDCDWNGKNISPIPDVPCGVLDYIGYLRWSDTLVVSEYFNCIRREVFERIRYPDNRAWETSFHLNIAYSWKLIVTRDVIVKIYTDASNRLTTGGGAWAMRRTLLEAPDKLDDLYSIWIQHGAAIQKYAPRRYQSMLREAGRLSFLCGKRLDGLYFITRYLIHNPLVLRAWMILGLGLISPALVAWVATRR